MPKGRRARRHARNRQPLPRRSPPTVAVEQPPPQAKLDVYPRPVTAAETGADRDDAVLTAELAAKLREIPVCSHCGGRHARACPRVKRMQFHPDGALAAVDFWPDGKWPTDDIIWPEDLAAADE